MKSAILATALVAVASVAAAEDTIAMISAEPAGAGQYEVVSQQDGVFTLSLINCLPMKAGVLDTAGNVADLVSAGSADMIEVERGTTEHAIATYACEG